MPDTATALMFPHSLTNRSAEILQIPRLKAKPCSDNFIEKTSVPHDTFIQTIDARLYSLSTQGNSLAPLNICLFSRVNSSNGEEKFMTTVKFSAIENKFIEQ